MPAMSAGIGLVGLGRMGMPICAGLARAGYDVTATDRRSELEPELAATGARWAESPRAVAEASDVLLTVLPGSDEVREALLSDDGALNGLRRGATWIDMSTCPPGAGRALAERAQAAGVRCLDAPMGGGVDAAAAGTLHLYVGGDPALVEEHRGVLSAMADPLHVRHVGAGGAGYLVKLLANLLWFGQAVATAEALLVAGRAGLDLDVVREAIASSAASSDFIRSDLGGLMDGEYLTTFSLDRCCEELEAVTTLAGELGVPHELASVVESIHLRALERYGPVDGELLGVSLLEEQAGLRIRHG
jgi:3-hydroxyisobutyrate dehydrogenase